MKQEEASGESNNPMGRIEEAVGINSGDREFEGEGSAQRAEGVQENVGRARREFSEYLAGLGKTVSN
jgi:uncharacterized protein YjbJ (UPF0337 family)